MIASSLRKRVPIHAFAGAGIIFRTELDMFILIRTNVRATGVLPNTSSPSSWRERSTDVLITACAFLEVTSANTMIMPADTRKYQGVLAEPSNEVINNVSGVAPLCVVKSM